MPRRLPPLNALRAFEAAARHLSFSKAAAELNVTPAAVSHQVKGLEDYVSRPLFRRLTRAIRLTDAGQSALPLLSEGLDRLAEGVQRMGRDEDSAVLTVTAPPVFAAKWLVHRLEEFRRVHPDIQVRLDTAMQVLDLNQEDVDMAVRFGPGGYPGMRSDILFEEEVFPVCGPKLMDGPHPLRRPEDLKHHTLVHVNRTSADDSWPDWRMWLSAAGVTGVDWTRGPEFDSEDLALETVMAGHGVALINSRAAARDRAEGRLCKPFELSIPVDFCYFVVSPAATAETPKIKAFREWILAEAAMDQGAEPWS